MVPMALVTLDGRQLDTPSPPIPAPEPVPPFTATIKTDPAGLVEAPPRPFTLVCVHVGPDAPPFFVIHGHNDTLVPVREARSFVEELRRTSRSPVVYAELPGAQHAFEVFPSIRTAHVVNGASSAKTRPAAHRNTISRQSLEELERTPARMPTPGSGGKRTRGKENLSGWIRVRGN